MYIDSLAVTLMILRYLRGWTIEESASYCNISSKYLGEILNKKRNPGIDILEKLCTGFNVCPNDVLNYYEMIKKRKEYQDGGIAQCYCFKNADCFQTYPVCPAFLEIFLKEYKIICSQCRGDLCRKNKDCHPKEKYYADCNRY